MKRNTPVSPPTLISLEAAKLGSQVFLPARAKKKGHREVTSETLLPIILEVGTLGHILLTDKFQLPDFFGNIRLMRFFISSIFCFLIKN